MSAGNPGLAREAPNVKYPPVLTGTQIRAARAAVRWSTMRLAQEANVSQQTVHNAERSNGIPRMNVATLEKIKGAFERAGIEFLDGRYAGEGGPGIRISPETEPQASV